MRRWFLGSMRLVSRPRAVLARPFTARARRQYSATGQRVVPVKRRLPRRWGASLARGWFRRGPARRRGDSLARSMSGPAVGAQDEVEREKFLREFQNRVDVDPGLAQYVAAGISKDTGVAMAGTLLQRSADEMFDSMDSNSDQVIDRSEVYRAFFPGNKRQLSKDEFREAFPMLRAGRAPLTEEKEEMSAADAADAAAVSPPTSAQLGLLSIKSGIPFVIFGFLDNFIMIMAGDYIDAQIGTALNLSVMASAALGNTVSDFVGQCSGEVIADATERLGFPNPRLTLEQSRTSAAKQWSRMGTILGIVVGCILGMIPLFFIVSAEDKQLEEAFRVLDENGNKVIEHNDLVKIFRTIALDSPEWVATRVMNSVEGRPFTLDEFKSQFRSAKGWMILNEKTIDLSGDVDLDLLVRLADDLILRKKTREEWAEIFKMVDTQRRGRIGTHQLVQVFLHLYDEGTRAGNMADVIELDTVVE